MAYNKSSSGLLVFCIVAVLVVSSEIHETEALHKGYKKCNQYCLDELKASSYDCYLFCFFKCAPSFGGSGCFKYLDEGQGIAVPDFGIDAAAPAPATTWEKWSSEMNAGGDVDSGGDVGLD